MNIDVLELGPMANCTYLLTQGKEAILIDPAWDMNFIEHTLKTKDLSLLAVFFTHGHFDHVRDCETLLRNHGLKAYLQEQDTALPPKETEEELIKYKEEKISNILNELFNVDESLIYDDEEDNKKKEGKTPEEIKKSDAVFNVITVILTALFFIKISLS